LFPPGRSKARKQPSVALRFDEPFHHRPTIGRNQVSRALAVAGTNASR
jgi:hypothetical protein